MAVRVATAEWAVWCTGWINRGATEDEEAICTAASLIIIKEFYPDYFEIFERSVMSHSYVGYQKGVPLAKELSYDMTKIRFYIESINYSK